MLMLLSPSKTQDFSPARSVAGHAPQSPLLLDESAALVKTLKKHSVAQLQELMGISEKLAELNHGRFQTFSTPFTSKNAKPAIFAFRGDVYDGLDADSLTDKQLAFAQTSLRMLSGLYGLLKPFDLMQPYRLEMGTPLTTRRGKNLYAFWGGRITEALNAELEGTKSKTVLNLASQEYASAVQPQDLAGDWVNVHFKEEKGNQLKVVGLFAKRARGSFARYVIQKRLSGMEKLHGFAEDGYRFRDDLSTPNDLIFSRKSAS